MYQISRNCQYACAADTVIEGMEAKEQTIRIKHVADKSVVVGEARKDAERVGANDMSVTIKKGKSRSK